MLTWTVHCSSQSPGTSNKVSPEMMVPVHLLLSASTGGTNLQLPSWTALKETLRSYNWTQFTQLGLPRMGFMGPVGPLTYYFPQLTMLDLSTNQLTGVIPPDLSTYSGLRYINLANNTLYGEY